MKYTQSLPTTPQGNSLALREYSREAIGLNDLMADIMGICPILFSLLNKYLLSSYYLPRTVLGAGIQYLKEPTAEWETDERISSHPTV